ncbi:hypothetical protein [Actinophytocola sp.]|uniref:hypothetical protein n=1 Tax=Actinophytocola sp. TaxID=1872138 RepID=UPI002ED59346
MSLRAKLVHAAVGVALAASSLIAVAEPAQAANTCRESQTIDGWQMGVCLTKIGVQVRGDVYINQRGATNCNLWVELWDDDNNQYTRDGWPCGNLPNGGRPVMGKSFYHSECELLHSHALIEWLDASGRPTGKVSRYGDSAKLAAC